SISRTSRSAVLAGETERRLTSAALAHPPWRAIGRQEVEERHGVECLRPEYAGARPDAVRQELERNDRVDRRLPDDRLRAVLRHGGLVVDHVVEVHTPPLAVETRSGDKGPGTRLPTHPVTQRTRIRQHCRDDVPWRHLGGPHPDLVGAV